LHLVGDLFGLNVTNISLRNSSKLSWMISSVRLHTAWIRFCQPGEPKG